jgi:antitoxin CptB
MQTDTVLDAAELNRLRWRLRRGLLENDLFIERFLERHGASLTTRHVRGLDALMALADNDLLDLLLRRRDPELAGALDRPEIHEVLALMRRPAADSEREKP